MPDFDLLPPLTRERILEFLSTAEGLDAKDVDAICQMMAVRPGLSVRATDADGFRGLHYIHADGTRLILLSRSAPEVGRAALHEIVHDMEKTEEYKYLVKRARKNKKALKEAEERVDRIQAEEQENTGTSEEEKAALREREVNAELVSALLTSSGFLSRYAAENKGGMRRALNVVKRFMKSLPIKKGKAYRAANRLSGLMRKAIDAAAADRREGVAYSFKGRTKDGRGIYEGNFPIGTPKKAKSQRILDYIQNVWSKRPISLVISNGETSRVIEAQFDPTVDETENTYTDAQKIAGGNRHGNRGERRVTLDLADDYYQIASESKYNYSKYEIGKDSPQHDGIKLWHYFVNDILFAEHGEKTLIPYTVTINVKEKNDGDFVYSFSARKTKEFPTRQTMHAAVNTRKGANGELFIDSIPDSDPKSNPSQKKSSNAHSSDDAEGGASFSRADPAETKESQKKLAQDKAKPYTQKGAEVVLGIACERAGVSLNRNEFEEVAREIYLASNISYDSKALETSADAAPHERKAPAEAPQVP